MKIVWLRRALANLEQEADYIGETDPAAAARVLARLREAVQRLADHPESGRPGRILGTRELVVSGLPYVIPYRVSGNQVQILRIFHTSRKWAEDG